MGLVYETSKWCDRLWSEHLVSSAHGRELVKQGIAKQGDPFAGFPADLHARLYLPTEPRRFACETPEWATRLHDMCLELGEYHQLNTICARNGFAAGIAAEVMLEMLLPHVPDRPDAQANRHSGDNGASLPTDTSKVTDLSNAELRGAIRRASRKAKQEVEDAERCIEGIGPGVDSGNSGRMNLTAVREAHAMLRHSPMMKKVAMLAGRFERIARGKARSKVQPGIGEIHGVETGGNLSRLLPSELVALKHPVLKRQLWAKLMEQRALTYAMQGREPRAKGPVIILLDESGSMRDEDRFIWSKAVALAMSFAVPILPNGNEPRKAFCLSSISSDERSGSPSRRTAPKLVGAGPGATQLTRMPFLPST